MSALTPLEPPCLPKELWTITSPFQLKSWQTLLKSHPDTQFADYILSGIQSGFRVGFSYDRCNLKARKRNMLSASQNSAVVNAYISKELEQGRMVHIPDPSVLPWFHTCPFGVIPKKHKPGKWRLIADLSAPEGHSVNDFICKELCSLSYISVDDVARAVHLGKGSLLAKADIEEAYRMIPVHPEDRLSRQSAPIWSALRPADIFRNWRRD